MKANIANMKANVANVKANVANMKAYIANVKANTANPPTRVSSAASERKGKKLKSFEDHHLAKARTWP